MVINSQLVIKELVQAFLSGLMTLDQIKPILVHLKSNVCSLSLSASTWLFSQLQMAENDQRNKLLLLLNELISPPNQVLEQPTSTNDDLESMPNSLAGYLNERSSLACKITKRLYQKHLPNLVDLEDQPKSLQIKSNLPSCIDLTKVNLNSKLELILESNQAFLPTHVVHELDDLVKLGGITWFTKRVVSHYFFQHEDVSCLADNVDAAYQLLHLDLEQSSIILLNDVLPSLLMYESSHKGLAEPTVSALVKLTIMTLFAAITQLTSFKKCDLSRRCGHRQNYQLEVYRNRQVCELTEELTRNTPYFYQMPKSFFKSSTNLSTNNIKLKESELTSVEEPMEIDELSTLKSASKTPSQTDCLAAIEEIHKEPLYIEFVRFVNLLHNMTVYDEFNARALLLQALLEQIVICLREGAGQLLMFIPFNMLDALIRQSSNTLTFEALLAYICLDSSRARKVGAKLLCQLHLINSFSK